MREVAQDEDTITIEFSRSELGVINNALNEIANGVQDLNDDSEFATRVGASRADVRQLLAQVHAIL